MKFASSYGFATQRELNDKLNTSNVKTSQNTTSGNVYDVTYINSVVGDIETLLGGI